jgi:hypothetical protein
MHAGDLARVVAAVGALAAGAGAVVVVAVLLSQTPGPVQAAPVPSPSPAAPAPAARPPSKIPAGFPAPPAGAVVFARADGANVLALAVRPRGPRQLLLQASVLGPQGTGVGGFDVSFTLQERSARATACGRGCYRALLPVAGQPRSVLVDVRGGPAATHWRVALPAGWPAADGSALMARAERVWRSLRSLSFRERLASDSSHSVRSVWRAAAPDRIAYTVSGGYSSVVIGGRRWDRAPGGRWVESSQTAPIHQPVPFWVSVTDARVLGSARLRGHDVWRVSFFDPDTPGWFEVAIDKRTLHTLELSMFTTAHFMHDVYGGFDEPAGIRPPG